MFIAENVYFSCLRLIMGVAHFLVSREEAAADMIFMFAKIYASTKVYKIMRNYLACTTKVKIATSACLLVQTNVWISLKQ